jgi:hypothetical protein
MSIPNANGSTTRFLPLSCLLAAAAGIILAWALPPLLPGDAGRGTLAAGLAAGVCVWYAACIAWYHHEVRALRQQLDGMAENLERVARSGMDLTLRQPPPTTPRSRACITPWINCCKTCAKRSPPSVATVKHWRPRPHARR